MQIVCCGYKPLTIVLVVLELHTDSFDYRLRWLLPFTLLPTLFRFYSKMRSLLLVLIGVFVVYGTVLETCEPYKACDLCLAVPGCNYCVKCKNIVSIIIKM